MPLLTQNFNILEESGGLYKMPTGLLLKIWIDNTRDTFSILKEFIEFFDNPKITEIYALDENEKVIRELKAKSDQKKNLSIDEIFYFLLNLDKPSLAIKVWGEFILPCSEYIYIKENKSKISYKIFLLLGSEYKYFIEDHPYVITHFHSTKKDFLEKLYMLLKNVVSKFDPLMVFMGPSTVGDDLSWWFEYYRDPYLFCIEPLEDEIPEFIFHENTNKRVEELKEILQRNELLKILEENSDIVIKGTKGIGVIRNVYELTDMAGYLPYIRPRYHIRKELRRRALRLKPGLTEEMVLEGLRKRPDEMRKLDVIDDELYKRIEETKNNVKKDIFGMLPKDILADLGYSDLTYEKIQEK